MKLDDRELGGVAAAVAANSGHNVTVCTIDSFRGLKESMVCSQVSASCCMIHSVSACVGYIGSEHFLDIRYSILDSPTMRFNFLKLLDRTLLYLLSGGGT